MKTFFLVLGFALALVLPGASFAQDDVWSKGFVFNSASNSGTDVWFGPGNKISTNGPLANQINGLMGRGNSTLVSAASGGLNVAETGAVAMRDGRVLAMTATRFASTANIFKAVKAVAGGPVGVSLLLMETMPALLAWINADGGVHIHSDPTTGAVQLVNGAVCTSGSCYNWTYTTCGTSAVYGTAASACAGLASALNAHICGGGIAGVTGSISTSPACVLSGTNYGSGWGETITMVQGSSRTPDTGFGYLPASMDDIAPYMTPRVPAPEILGQIAAAGASVDVTPVSISNGTVPSNAPFVKPIAYPKPPDVTGSSTVAGNPYGLANNTPTVTSSNTVNKPVAAGSSFTSGSTAIGSGYGVGAAGASTVAGGVSTPATTTATSTYNPTTNQTTTATTTSQDGATAVQTTTQTTNVTNNSTSSSVSNTYNTTTNITNLTTGVAIGAPIVDTTAPPPAPAPDAKTDCDKYQDDIGCSKYGVPRLAEPIPKLSVPVTWTNVSFAGAGSCPADIPVTIGMGGVGAVAFSFSAMCNLMTTLAPLFLALGAAAAAWLFMEGLKA